MQLCTKLMRKHAPPRRNNLAIKALGRNGLKKNLAFTLAEVLITLGIIGVISALTLPSLILNYKNKVVETKLKKIYSIMNQAIVLSEGTNGNLEDWDFENPEFLNTYILTKQI